jgi:hemerythrin-like metal-binding protein
LSRRSRIFDALQLLRKEERVAAVASGQAIKVDVVVSEPAVRESTRILLDVHDFAGRDFALGRDYILGGTPHPNCLITDRILTDMTGMELLEHLRTSGDATPAVMMTGRIDAETVTRAGRLSLTLVEKPPLSDALFDSIEEACHSGAASDPKAATVSARFPAAFEAAQDETPCWIDHAGTGVAVFDAEHRRLNEMVLDYYDAILAREPQASLDHLFERLAALTTDHFTHEENYMRFVGYADAGRHMGAHRSLITALMKVPEIAGHDGEDRSLRALEVLRFLKHWLMDHIAEEDTKLGGYLNDRGIR